MGGYDPFFKNDIPFFERSEFPHLSDRQFNAYKKSFESDFTLDRDEVYKILKEHDDDEKTYLKKGNTMGDPPPGFLIPGPEYVNFYGGLLGTMKDAAIKFVGGTPTENDREISSILSGIPTKGQIGTQKKQVNNNRIKTVERLAKRQKTANIDSTINPEWSSSPTNPTLPFNPPPSGFYGTFASPTPIQPPTFKTPSSKTPSSKTPSSKTPSSVPSQAPTGVPTGTPTKQTNITLDDIKGQAMPRFTKRDEPVIADPSYLPVGDSQAITASATSDPTMPVSDLPTEHVIPTPAATPPSGESNNFIPGGKVPQTPVTPLVIPPTLNDETLKNNAPGAVDPGLAANGFVKALLGGGVGIAASVMAGPMFGGLAAALVSEGMRYTLPNSYSEDYGARYGRYIRFKSQAKALLQPEQYRTRNFGGGGGGGGGGGVGFDGFDDDDKGPKGPKDGKNQVGLLMKDVSSFIKYASIPV